MVGGPDQTTIRATINTLSNLKSLVEIDRICPRIILGDITDELPTACCGIVDEVLRLRSSCETMGVAKRSTYNNVEPEQAKTLGRLLRTRREELGLSSRQLAEQAAMDDATIVRIEQGAFAAPAPDKLARIAEALGLSLADVYALADYTVPHDLPTFAPYLRAKYRTLPPKALSELKDYFNELTARYGIDPAGPAPGEDETPAQPRRKKR